MTYAELTSREDLDVAATVVAEGVQVTARNAEGQTLSASGADLDEAAAGILPHLEVFAPAE